MSDSPKLRRLIELKEKLERGKLSDAERKNTTITDTAGNQVRMDAPGILEVLKARIAAEQGG